MIRLAASISPRLVRSDVSAAVRARGVTITAMRPVFAAGALAIVVSMMVVAAILYAPVARDPVPGFGQRKGRLVHVETENVTRHHSGEITEFRLRSDSGLHVELTVSAPAGPARPRPTALILGGKQTGRDAARLHAGHPDVVLAALSYPFDGDPDVRDLQAVLATRDIQRAVLDTVPAIRLAADFLTEQPFVDAQRLELIGVSLGAFFVAPAGALDERFRRVWIVHGAARPHDVMEFALRDDVECKPLRRSLAALLNTLIAGDYLDAERWAPRISPRPVIAINAAEDERLPRDAVLALHNALGDPHDVIWTQGAHVEPGRATVIEDLAERILGPVSADAP
jgi:dienelactone hydrolase